MYSSRFRVTGKKCKPTSASWRGKFFAQSISASLWRKFCIDLRRIQLQEAYIATYHDSVLYIGEDHRGSSVHDLGRPLKRFLLTWFDVNHCLRVVIEIDLFSPTSAKTSARCQLVGAGRSVFIVLQTWSFFMSFRYSSLHPHDYNETLQHKVKVSLHPFTCQWCSVEALLQTFGCSIKTQGAWLCRISFFRVFRRRGILWWRPRRQRASGRLGSRTNLMHFEHDRRHRRTSRCPWTNWESSYWTSIVSPSSSWHNIAAWWSSQMKFLQHLQGCSILNALRPRQTQIANANEKEDAMNEMGQHSSNLR